MPNCYPQPELRTTASRPEKLANGATILASSPVLPAPRGRLPACIVLAHYEDMYVTWLAFPGNLPMWVCSQGEYTGSFEEACEDFLERSQEELKKYRRPLGAA